MSPLFSLILLMLSSETFDNLDTCRSLAGRNALLLSRTSWLVSRGLSFLFTTPSLQFTSPAKTVYLHRRYPTGARCGLWNRRLAHGDGPHVSHQREAGRWRYQRQDGDVCSCSG